MALSGSSFYIADGVRRCVAARELGLNDIEAKVVVPGKPDYLAVLYLNELFSPKTTIDRNARDLRIELAMSAGKQLPCIEVQPLGGVAGQTRTIPLAKVRLK